MVALVFIRAERLPVWWRKVVKDPGDREDEEVEVHVVRSMVVILPGRRH